MVGQLVRSSGVVEVLEPILKLSSPPDDFKAFIKFLNSNADTLATSRMLFAAMPARSGLPQTIVAIELPSAEEAQKFEPKVQKLLPILFPTPTPTPTPSPTPTPAASPSTKNAGDKQPTIVAEPVLISVAKPSPPPLVMSDEKARQLGMRPRARILASSVAAIRPEIMGLGPIPAIQKLLQSTGMTIGDIDVVEINEAFAAQIVPCKQELSIEDEKLNPFGGAIALGHPFGMTGARIMTTLLNDLETLDATYGLESMCVAGGMGMAMLVERL